MPAATGPLPLYRAMVAAGDLRSDPVQLLAAEKLQSLHHAVAGYEPATGSGGWLARFGLTGGRRGDSAPHGLYLYGGVGRGKSMLMDLFHRTAPVHETRRVHFHAFMRDAHEHLNRDGAARDGDSIEALARSIVADSWLLCLDELEIHDIADAMIVGRLFQALLEQGAVVVTTSNRHPRSLYKDGLQREKFLPFIDLIEQRFDLLELDSPRDYRLDRLRGRPVWHVPAGPGATAALAETFTRLADGEAGAPCAIRIKGRDIRVPRAAGGVAWFGFADLCETALGPSDYLEIARIFHSVIVQDIPLLSPARRDAARRFVTLVDALYDHKVNLIASAAADPAQIYPAGDGAFEFQRTASRLIEMQAEDYLGRAHLG